MKVAFIVKPPLKEEYQREFLAFEREFKGEIKEEFTEKEGPNNAKNLAKKAVEESFERVVVVGGDGLLNETINGIAEATGGKIPQDFTLGIIPTGSGNNFAKALGIPKDIKKAFEIIKKERPEFCINCGPEAMIREAIKKESKYLSQEKIYSSIEFLTRCGIGLCGSCATSKGYRSCIDGTFLKNNQLGF